MIPFVISETVLLSKHVIRTSGRAMRKSTDGVKGPEPDRVSGTPQIYWPSGPLVFEAKLQFLYLLHIRVIIN